VKEVQDGIDKLERDQDTIVTKIRLLKTIAENNA
jgi:hypothetical protein